MDIQPGIPTPPPAPPRLGRLDPPLAFAAPADGRPFRLAGEGVVVEGTTRAGVAGVWSRAGAVVAGVRVTAGLDDGLAAATAANAIEAPRLLRRELIVPGATLIETIVVPGRLAGVALQWSLAADREWRGAVEIELPDGVDLLVQAAGTARLAGADGRGALVHVHPAAEWKQDGRTVRALVALPAGTPLTFLVGAVDDPARLPSLTALSALDAHVRRAEADARGDDGVRLVTGVPELDDGVLWARAALRGLPPASDRPPDSTFLDPPSWRVLGALAAGERDAAETALSADPGHPLDVLAHAAWVEWIGRPGRLLARADRLESLTADAPTAWRPLLRSRLADALEGAGDPGRAGRLRAAADPTQRSHRTLPMAGESPETLLARALVGAPDPADRPTGLPPSPEGDDGAALLHAVARYALDDPETAFATLRPLLGAPVRSGPAPDPLRPALVLHTLVRGMLGARPDAAYGRLRLAPALPAAWTRFRVEGLRVADTSLTLDYRRDGTVHTWRAIPDAGALPMMLVLEPSFAGEATGPVLIDGAPAAVERVARRGRTRVRVQLPLDAERSLTVE